MLEPIVPGVWHATSSQRILPGAHLPSRMTIVSRRDGSLVLHSPVEIDAELVRAVAALGRVTEVVAPNCLHHLHAAAALRHFPGARCFVAAGVEKKQPDLPVAGFLHEAQEEFSPDFTLTQVQGIPRLNEWLFYHRASRTLIAADLVFNVQNPIGWLSALLLRGAGTYKRCAISRLVASQIVDRQAFVESVQAALAVDIEVLVMSHGDVIRHEARRAIEHALVERGLGVP